MNIRKLLDWRKALIYSHRWLGIGVGIVFVLWCVSGFVLMYYGIPTLKAGERLLRLPPLDLSAVRVAPAEAVRKLGLKDPTRLRISMQGNRPVYRINTGRGFGNWTIVYADTGEKMKPMDAEAAMEWMRRFRPDHASNLRYDAYLTTPDHFVRIPAMQVQLPFIASRSMTQRDGVLRLREDGRSRCESGPNRANSRIHGLHAAPLFLVAPQVLVQRLALLGVVDRNRDVYHRTRRRCVALQPQSAIPPENAPLAFAISGVDEMASLCRPDFRVDHFYLDGQRRGGCSRHSGTE
jgi:hypothetical protein